MGKTCDWCGTVLRVLSGAISTKSVTICQGCHEELQTALSTKGLRAGENQAQAN